MITSSQSSTSSSSSVVPAKRPRVVTNPAAVLQNPELEEENDAEELRNRRLQHIVENARGHHSPTCSPRERRQELVGRNGMTNMQISEHYASCLKLCAENKINSKNAFSLHLIDFMSDMLRQADDSETNFQVAGTSLDASAKIYAYRVESVHRETLKIAGGLGRPDRHESNQCEDDDDMAGGEPAECVDQAAAKPAKKRRKKVTKGNAIETNEKSLNMHVNDSEFAGDALFDKVRSNFDEGSSSGLFLNTLSSVSDSNTLLLHCLGAQPSNHAAACKNAPPVDLTDISEMLERVNLNGAKTVCPGFDDFAFIGWKPDFNPDKQRNEECQEEMTEKDCGKFAVVLPPTPPHQSDFGLEDEDCGGSDHDDFDAGSVTSVTQRGPTVEGIVCVSPQPQVLSCFDPNNISMLSGGTHWRVKAKLHSLKREYVDPKGANGPAAKGRRVAVKRPRKRKEETRLSFELELEPNSVVPMGSGATVLSKATLEKWQTESASLEMEDSEKVDTLHRLFTKPDLWLLGGKSQRQTASNDATKGVLPNGESDFMESDGQFGNDDYDADDDGADNDIDFGAPVGAANNDDHSAAAAGNSGTTTALASTEVCAAGGTMDGGLLPQPSGVINKAAIPTYERRAKKIDARRVKNAVWSILTKNKSTDAPEQEPQGSATGGKPSPAKGMTGPKSFSELFAELPNYLPDHLAQNLSVPIVFVCLLHLCNERTLFLESEEDLADVIIKPGRSEHESDNETPGTSGGDCTIMH